MIAAHYEAAKLPPRYDCQALSFFMSKSNVSSNSDFVLFAGVHSRLITVTGARGCGKTKFAIGMMQYAIRLRWQNFIDPVRFHYTAATRAFDDSERYRFETEHEIHRLLQYSGLLVLDNVDFLPDRHVAAATALIVERCDTGYSTVITATDMKFINSEILRSVVQKGRMIHA